MEEPSRRPHGPACQLLRLEYRGAVFPVFALGGVNARIEDLKIGDLQRGRGPSRVHWHDAVTRRPWARCCEEARRRLRAVELRACLRKHGSHVHACMREPPGLKKLR